MKTIDELRKRAKNLKHEITAIYYAYQNPEMPLLPKIIIGITLAYALSPIDLIPDFIPVIGYLDDLIIVPALLGLALKRIPESIMVEAREKAQKEPIRLSKNWAFAVVFIAIWLAILAVIVMAVIRLFSK